MACGIYEIVNKINGKRYIGSSDNIKRRFWTHKNLLNKNKHHNENLQRAWNKYGSDSFTFDIIHECPEDMLIVCEQWMIDQYDFDKALYNSFKIVGLPMKGVHHSDEAKNKISDTHRGRIFSAEHKQRISESKRGTLHSEETKNKISDSKKGVSYNIGRKCSSDTKIKISKKLTGRTISEETRRNMAKSKKGQIPWNKGLKIKNPLEF